MMKPKYIKHRNANGSFIPSDEFDDMIIDSDERFRAAVITFINDEIKNDWAVIFTPFVKDIYDVRIFCDTNEEYKTIVNIVKDRLRNETFNDFILEGNTNDIDSRY